VAEVAERVVAVALLGRADEAREQLRSALLELGASVVVEADPRSVDCASVLAGRPEVVLVNLDAGIEDAIDHLQPIFDDERIQVVFNEAQVSSQLSGWDRARWARHLAAKLLGHGDTNPPRPPQAEALPDHNLLPTPGAPVTPAQMAARFELRDFASDVAETVDQVPSEPRLAEALVDDAFADALSQASIPAETPLAPAEDLGDFDLDLGEIEGALLDVEFKPEVSGASVPDAPPAVEEDASLADFDFDFGALDETLRLDEMAEALPEAAVAESVEASASGTVADAEFDLDLGDMDLSGIGDSDAAVPATGDEPPAAAGDLGLVDFDFDESAAEVRLGDLALDGEAELGGLDEDPELAQLAAAFEAQHESVSEASPEAEQGLDFLLEDFEEAPAEPVATAPAAVPPPPAPAAAASTPSFSLDSLSLEPLTDVPAEAPKPAPSPSATGQRVASYNFDTLEFSLEPLDENEGEAPPPGSVTAAPPPVPPPVPPVARSSALQLEDEAATATDGLRRVIVLGASIGGPDALRAFLAEIPADFPALFLLAQHLDSGFFERLADQLQKVSRMPVKLPADGAKLGLGQVVVATASERLVLDRQGNARLEPHASRPTYSPSIDTLLRDTSDTFGAQASAIIFSGMAGDAIEGAAYLASRGGEVWVQDPKSCVVSSMVDGITARGLAEFTGSPRELARQCIAKYGGAG
jgi:chemotaxis response regulator CheB